MTILILLLGLFSFSQPVEIVPPESTVDALYLSTDDGASWTNFAKGLPANVQTRTVFEHEGTLFLITGNHGIFRLAKNSDTWRRSSTGLPFNEPFFHPLSLTVTGNVLVLGTFQDGVFLSRDGGRTWYASPDHFEQVAANFLPTGEVLLAGTHAGIWTSGDNGEHWNRNEEDLTPINGMLMHRGKIHVARQNGMGVLEDGKIVWSEMRSDWAIIQLLQDEEYIYAVSAYREIFRSRDGKHWESPCEEGIIRQPQTLAQYLWNGYRPAPPTQLVPATIVNTSRGWVLPVNNGGC
ncbi:hypothetical protein [Lewinella sp. W8]|uniref:WD40/YVTN/BNR-like repeat-containing protein n=1 Tax=Lewinella sp. W8 TaxID=2528208 RepID=UPI0010684522|nr:hypothetical protein [Lewinella sp. W8]MTB52102.1 hypothetical protein [Lewinella sp. W8]